MSDEAREDAKKRLHVALSREVSFYRVALAQVIDRILPDMKKAGATPSFADLDRLTLSVCINTRAAADVNCLPVRLPDEEPLPKKKKQPRAEGEAK